MTWLGLMGWGKGIELTAASDLGLMSMKRHRPVSGTCSRLLGQDIRRRDVKA